MADLTGKVFLHAEKDEDGKIVVKQCFEYILHSKDCNNSDEDIELMKFKLANDPHSLKRLSYEVHMEDGNVTALYDAASSNHDKCVEFLVNSGADLTNELNYPVNLVESMMENGYWDTLKYLFNNNILSPIYNNTNTFPSNYYLQFVLCIENKNIENIDVLIDYGVKVVDVNNFDISLDTYPDYAPLCQTLYYYNDADLLKHLIQRGGILNYEQTGRTDLSGEVKDCLSFIHHYVLAALDSEKYEIAKLLVIYEFGANLWEKNRFGLTPLEVRQNIIFINSELDARSGFIDHIDHDEILETIPAQQITKMIKKLMSKPLSLQSWARITIMREKGSDFLKYVNELENVLPNDILKFLRAEELKNCYTDDEISSLLS